MFRNNRQRERALCFKHVADSELKLPQAVYTHQSSHHFQKKTRKILLYRPGRHSPLSLGSLFFSLNSSPRSLCLFWPSSPLLWAGISLAFWTWEPDWKRAIHEETAIRFMSISIALPSDFPCTSKALCDSIPDWLQLMENFPNAKKECLSRFPREPHLPSKTQILLRISNPGKWKSSHDIQWGSQTNSSLKEYRSQKMD